VSEDNFFFPECFTSEEFSEFFSLDFELDCWPEVPESEGEWADIEFPFRRELTEKDFSPPLDDPFLFVEDDNLNIIGPSQETSVE
jgi:hypothetical protein